MFEKMKQKFYDFLWYKIGLKLWKKSARLHPKDEVLRRLNWMTLDNDGKHHIQNLMEVIKLTQELAEKQKK